MIFTNIQELAQTTGIKEKCYYVSFTDGTTQCTQIYFIKKKNILRHIKDYQAFIKTQTGKNLKTIQFDSGEKYIDYEVIDYLKSYGI